MPMQHPSEAFLRVWGVLWFLGGAQGQWVQPVGYTSGCLAGENAVVVQSPSTSLQGCFAACMADRRCASIDWYADHSVCRLSYTTAASSGAGFTSTAQCQYWEYQPAQPLNDWQQPSGYPGYGCLSGNNNVNLKGGSLDSCKAACIKDTRCLSIDWYTDNTVCRLSYNTQSTSGAKFTTTGRCRYYEYGASAGLGVWSQPSDYLTGCLAGNNNRDLGRLSLPQCQAVCEADRNCNSIDHYVDGSVCRLSYTTRAISGSSYTSTAQCRYFEYGTFVDTPATPLVHFQIGADYPYAHHENELLQDDMGSMSMTSEAQFFVHAGDIKTAASECSEWRYEEVSDILMQSDKPVFIVPGDNEWNDCDNYPASIGHWHTHFGHTSSFGQHWTQVPWVSDIRWQTGKEPNFAFTLHSTLVVGLHVAGYNRRHPAEFAATMQEAAIWVVHQFSSLGQTCKAAVVILHASMNSNHRIFRDALLTAATSFEDEIGLKPVFVFHGDLHEHTDSLRNGYRGVPNIRKVMLAQGGSEFPLRVTIQHHSDPRVHRLDWMTFTRQKR